VAQGSAPAAAIKRPRRTIPGYRLDPRRRARQGCGFCGRTNVRNSPSCGRRDCPGCIDLWLNDNRVRIFHNLNSEGGDVVMTTITAPSLAWDHSHCADRGPHRCSGRLGCRVDPKVAVSFNRTAADRLSQLHKVAYQRTYRRFGPRTCRRLAYAPEPQRRGVIHWHVVIAYSTPHERAAARFYVRNLHALTGQHGYGFVDRKFKPAPPVKAAYYISKYLTKGDYSKPGLRELVLSRQAPARPVYVARSLTDRTRVTMRNLRWRRAIYMHSGITVAPTEVEPIWRILKAFPGARIDPTPAEPARGP
jgi:hypothetical protein